MGQQVFTRADIERIFEDRARMMYEMRLETRERPITYRDIAKKFGLTRQRAEAIIKSYAQAHGLSLPE